MKRQIRRAQREHRILCTSQGQSLVEVVVIIGIVAVLVSGLVLGSTRALRASESGKTRSVASKYAQEGLELSRKLRDQGWGTFYTFVNNLPLVNSYLVACLDEDGVWSGGSSGCPINIDNQYSRTIQFQLISNDQARVTAQVSWAEGDKVLVSQQATVLTQWR